MEPMKENILIINAFFNVSRSSNILANEFKSELFCMPKTQIRNKATNFAIETEKKNCELSFEDWKIDGFNEKATLFERLNESGRVSFN